MPHMRTPHIVKYITGAIEQKMNLKRERFYRDWYKRKRREPDSQITWILIALFVLVGIALVLSQCMHVYTPADSEPNNVHYEMLDDERIMKITDDTVEIGYYYEY